MGQYSLLAVVGAFLISAVVVYNASKSAGDAEEKVWEHQYHVVARDAASTGMSASTRRLSATLNAAGGWSSGTAGPLNEADVAYDDGRYTVEASSAPDACSLLTSANFADAVSANSLVIDGEVIEVRVTGEYDGDVGDDGDTVQSHQIVACYVKADWGLFSPPAFNFGFISDDDFTFNGGAEIQALVDGSGHVHSNDNIKLGPQVVIDGIVTYVGTPDIKSSAQIDGQEKGINVPMTAFEADDFATDFTSSATTTAAGMATYCSANPLKCRYNAGFTSSSAVTIDPTPANTADRYADKPYVWFVNGDLTLSGGAHIKVPQYTTIVVTGNISIGGNSAVTTTGETMNAYCQRVANKNCSQINPQTLQDQRIKEWVVSQLFDGQHSPLAWYGEGNVDINGTSALVGNFYVNGDVTLNGGGQGNNTIGSFASTGGDVTANGGGGGGNFWFLEVAEKNVIDGVKLPGKQIVRLAAAEWTDPVLDH